MLVTVHGRECPVWAVTDLKDLAVTLVRTGKGVEKELAALFSHPFVMRKIISLT